MFFKPGGNFLNKNKLVVATGFFNLNPCLNHGYVFAIFSHGLNDIVLLIHRHVLNMQIKTKCIAR